MNPNIIITLVAASIAACLTKAKNLLESVLAYIMAFPGQAILSSWGLTLACYPLAITRLFSKNLLAVFLILCILALVFHLLVEINKHEILINKQAVRILEQDDERNALTIEHASQLHDKDVKIAELTSDLRDRQSVYAKLNQKHLKECNTARYLKETLNVNQRFLTRKGEEVETLRKAKADQDEELKALRIEKDKRIEDLQSEITEHKKEVSQVIEKLLNMFKRAASITYPEFYSAFYPEQ